MLPLLALSCDGGRGDDYELRNGNKEADCGQGISHEVGACGRAVKLATEIKPDIDLKVLYKQSPASRGISLVCFLPRLSDSTALCYLTEPRSRF